MENEVPVVPVKKKKGWIIGVVIGAILLIVAGAGIFVYFKYFESKIIPNSWLTYKNNYYGYAFKYDPEIIVQPDIYGNKEGEDLGVVVHSLKDNTPENRKFERGDRLDKTVDNWYFEINKPNFGSVEEMPDLKENGCEALKTNSGLGYYECNHDQGWGFNIFLNNQIYIYFVVSPKNNFSKADQLLIKRMVNSFAMVGENKMMVYPSKSVLKSWMSMYWCDNQNKLLEEYENGIKQYSRNSVLTSSEVLDVVYLAKPRSYCEVPVYQTPYLPTEDCPYPGKSDLGESTNKVICANELPVNAMEDNCEETTKLLYDQAQKVTLPAGWKYVSKSSGRELIALPPNWQELESPIKSCNSDYIEFRNPKMEVVVTLTREKMASTDMTSDIAVNLGKFECGKYAECELVREVAIGDFQYEYQLLVKGQPSVVAKPNKIRVKFFDDTNEKTLLPVIDQMAKTAIFLDENEVE